jgi:aspartate-semialdehyde dehydrogenase
MNNFFQFYTIIWLFKLNRGTGSNVQNKCSTKFITYFEEENRPQSKLDRDIERGMGVSAGRLREDSIYDYKFVGLSHNTLRGAAGGAVLIAELLKAEGYIQAK